MKKQNQKEVLEAKIALLKQKKILELAELKLQYNETKTHITPLNLIKYATSEIIATTNFKGTLYKFALNLGANYISTSVLNTSSVGVATKLLKKVSKFFTK